MAAGAGVAAGTVVVTGGYGRTQARLVAVGDELLLPIVDTIHDI